MRGGINGSNLVDNWPVYTLFADPLVIRNYFGNMVGFEIAFKLYMAYFFVLIVVVYFIIFMFELIFGSTLIIIIVQLLTLAISFSAYLTIWSKYEDQFI